MKRDFLNQPHASEYDPNMPLDAIDRYQYVDIHKN
jgi:hypothetical protein